MKRILRTGFLILCLLCALKAQTLEDALKAADLLQQEGKIEQALDQLEQIVAEYPESSAVHLKLGRLYGESAGIAFRANDFTTAGKEVSLAFESLEEAIRLDPENVEARLTYGIMGMQVPEFFGKLDPGVRHLEQGKKIVEQQPADQGTDLKLTFYRYLGEGYVKQKRNAEAVAVWEDLLKIKNEGEQADAVWKKLAELKLALVSTDEADTTTQPPDMDHLLDDGKMYLEQKNYQKARDAFEAVLSEDENHVEAQMLLISTLRQDGSREYDARVYENQDTRTHLVFDLMREMERGMMLAPDNQQLKLEFATIAVYMPYFVEKIDKGLKILEELSRDESLPDSVRQQVKYVLGFGYRKKGNAVWANLVQEDQTSMLAQQVYDVFGLREYRHSDSVAGERVTVDFHLGFLDELAPQTAIWIENENGEFIKTIYVSGFAGNAKEKQITLRKWGEATQFETDGTTAASIDWGTHQFAWDLTDHSGKKIENGHYKVRMEVSWWPTYRYALTEASVDIGKKENVSSGKKDPFIPKFEVAYLKK